MNPAVLLSVTEGRASNYLAAFSEYGFEVCAEYCPKDVGYDALVLCGGGDIDPAFYGMDRGMSYEPDILRDKGELSLFEAYIKNGKPVMGICRGMQLINVAMGGTLIRHLECSDTHLGHGDRDSVHIIENIRHSSFFAMYGENMVTNSYHHQACERIAKGLLTAQRHSDGTVEAIEGKGIVAVQWHPERMNAFFDRDGVYSDPSRLFLYFKNMIV